MKKKSVFMKCMSQILSHERYEMLDCYIKNQRKEGMQSGLEYRMPYFYSKKKSKEKYCIFRFTMEGPLLLAIAKQYIFIAEWAEKNGYIPIIDLEYEQVYKEGRIGEDNVWEYCFQPKLGIKDVLKKEYVFIEALYSNYYMDTYTCHAINGDSLDCSIHICQENWREYYKNVNKYAKKHWRFNREFEDKFKSEVASRLTTGNILGVSLREEFSTDVNSLLTQQMAKEGLALHPMSSGIKEVVKVVKEYMKKWRCDKIFLSTICQESVDIFMKEFEGRVIAVNRQRMTFQEIAGDVDEACEIEMEEKYRRHLEPEVREEEYKKTITYMQEVLALSKCKCLIGMKSSGTAVALSLNGGKYDNIYIMPDINRIERY